MKCAEKVVSLTVKSLILMESCSKVKEEKPSLEKRRRLKPDAVHTVFLKSKLRMCSH